MDGETLALLRILSGGSLDIYGIDHELVRSSATPLAPSALRASLDRLADERLISVTSMSVGSQSNDVYSMTEKGREHFRTSRAHAAGAANEAEQHDSLPQVSRDTRDHLRDSDELWFARFASALHMGPVSAPRIVAALGEVRRQCALTGNTPRVEFGEPHACARSFDLSVEPRSLRGLQALAVPTGILSLVLTGSAAVALQRGHLAYVTVLVLAMVVVLGGWFAVRAWRPDWFCQVFGGPRLTPLNMARGAVGLTLLLLAVAGQDLWPSSVPRYVGFVPAWIAATSGAVFLGLHVAVVLRTRFLITTEYRALGIDRVRAGQDAVTKKVAALPPLWVFPMSVTGLCVLTLAFA